MSRRRAGGRLGGPKAVQSEAARGAPFKSREVSNHGGLGRPIGYPKTKVRLFQREPLCPSASMSREIDAAFATFGAERPDALFVSPTLPLLTIFWSDGER